MRTSICRRRVKYGRNLCPLKLKVNILSNFWKVSFFDTFSLIISVFQMFFSFKNIFSILWKFSKKYETFRKFFEIIGKKIDHNSFHNFWNLYNISNFRNISKFFEIFSIFFNYSCHCQLVKYLNLGKHLIKFKNWFVLRGQIGTFFGSDLCKKNVKIYFFHFLSSIKVFILANFYIFNFST